MFVRTAIAAADDTKPLTQRAVDFWEKITDSLALAHTPRERLALTFRNHLWSCGYRPLGVDNKFGDDLVMAWPRGDIRLDNLNPAHFDWERFAKADAPIFLMGINRQNRFMRTDKEGFLIGAIQSRSEIGKSYRPGIVQETSVTTRKLFVATLSELVERAPVIQPFIMAMGCEPTRKLKRRMNECLAEARK